MTAGEFPEYIEMEIESLLQSIPPSHTVHRSVSR